MKNSKKIIIIAAALVLASVLALCGCMHLISGPPVETKEYTPDEMTMPPVLDQTPTAQSEMQKKYSAYGREEIGENGEKIFYLYTSEQLTDYLESKNNDERKPLSYEDVTYIINDSVRLYFEYDKIYFSEGVETASGAIQYLSGLHRGGSEDKRFRISKLEDDRYVTPYHGDFSEFSQGDPSDPESAEYRYSQMLYEIYVIIYKRLGVHGEVFEFARGDIYSGQDYMGMLLDGGVIQYKEGYRFRAFSAIVDTLTALKNGEILKNDYPVVIFSLFSNDDRFITIVNDGVCESVFPTKALIDLDPTK